MTIDALPLRLKNSSKALGAGRWEWEAWLEGPDAALDHVVSVRYTLHHSFPDPVRTVTDRASKFALRSSGWGEFTLHADVSSRQGDSFRLEHWLRLDIIDGNQAKASGRKPTLFLSFGATDMRFAHALKKDLGDHGVHIVTPEDAIAAGLSWPQECGAIIAAADVAAFLTSGELRGFAEIEVEQARKHNKRIVPIVIGDSPVPQRLEGLDALRFDPLGPTDTITDTLVARVKDAFYPDES